jgi:hypothetical protein
LTEKILQLNNKKALTKKVSAFLKCYLAVADCSRQPVFP